LLSLLGITTLLGINANMLAKFNNSSGIKINQEDNPPRRKYISPPEVAGSESL
jgi:hypothetical protein